MVVAFKNLLNRDVGGDPLSNSIGVWSFWTTNLDSGIRYYHFQTIENLLMLIPFSFIKMCLIDQSKCNLPYLKVIQYSTVGSFFFSCFIEISQLVLFLGTFQLSDLFYNTCGDFLGGLFFFIVANCKIKLEK
ncbi:TPA: VanZ family protein [Enterococcus faecium]|nr:VanZ family protein [Enterococcus faecium]